MAALRLGLAALARHYRIEDKVLDGLRQQACRQPA